MSASEVAERAACAHCACCLEWQRMSRPLRIQAAGTVYHVTARGVARCRIIRDRGDYETFEAILARTIAKFGWICHDFCVMGTHYHLLIQTPEPNIAAGMQYLNGCYAQSFNRRHGRVGHLFQGRYHTALVESDPHLLQLVRYLAHNPVRARICASPSDWTHGSYHALSRGSPLPFVHPRTILDQFSPHPQRALDALRDFVEGANRPP